MEQNIDLKSDMDIGLIKSDIDQKEVESKQDTPRPLTMTGQKLLTEAAELRQNSVISPDKVTNTAKIAPHIIKFQKYERGDNFAIFCERFIEYICISKIHDINLYLIFLQYVNDDQTYSILKSVDLTRAEKGNAKYFCEKYKHAFYGDEKLLLKNELLNCKQHTNENIDEYVYKLRRKATVAYKNQENADEMCLIVFLRGVKDPDMRIKLAEAS